MTRSSFDNYTEPCLNYENIPSHLTVDLLLVLTMWRLMI